MTLLTKTRSLMPKLASDFFEGERFLFPNLIDMDGDFGNFGLGVRMPSVNIRETEKDFQLELAVPGLERKDFKVDFEEGMLNISVEKEEKKEEKKNNYRRKEYSFDSFTRSFMLPENVMTEKIDAKYENGILLVILPKKEVSITKPKKEIKVS